MNRHYRIFSEAKIAFRTFLRRRTAVVFTFLFPLILVIIFGALISTDPSGGGLFAEPPEYYVAGYIAVVVLFTPMSRMSAEVIRHRKDNRFEKLTTTPLTRVEWFIAHTIVTTVLVIVASVLIIIVLVTFGGSPIPKSPIIPVFIFAGVAVFAGIGAFLGRIAQTQDGAIAASNTIALPMLFLAETFVPIDFLPVWFRPAVELMPLTPFTRGVRAIMYGEPWLTNFLILLLLAILFSIVGYRSLPNAD